MNEISESVRRFLNISETDSESNQEETITISKSEYESLRSEISDLRDELTDLYSQLCDRISAVEYASGIREKSELDTKKELTELFKRHSLKPVIEFEDDVVENKEEVIYEILQKRKNFNPAFISISEIKRLFPEISEHNVTVRRLMKKVVKLHSDELELGKKKIKNRETTVIEFVKKC